MTNKLSLVEIIRFLHPTVSDSIACWELLEDKMINAVSEQRDLEFQGVAPAKNQTGTTPLH